MVSAGYGHDPAVMGLIADHLGVPEIPASRVFSVLPGILDDDSPVIRIHPGPAPVLAVGDADALIAVRSVRIERRVIGDQPLAPGIGEQPRCVV
ncbi:hypothetical protein D3C75_351820 [compost metagenome]